MGTANHHPQPTILTLLLLLLPPAWLCFQCINAEITFLGQEPHHAFVSQGSQNGDTVYQFFVVDTSILNQDPNPIGLTFSRTQSNSVPFILDPSTGEIVVTDSLSTDEYFFTVQATSSGVTIATNITITVVSLSDTVPRFEHNLYRIQIAEDLPVRTAISALRAFSLNPAATTRTYSIVSGNTDSAFSITTNNGLLRIDSGLDRERTASYQLIMRYVDDDSSVDTTVLIMVIDVNDESPTFSQSLYNVTIPEITSLHSLVLVVNASDGDIGTNAQVTYILESTASSTFSLGAEDGILRTASLLDFERLPRYQFRVTAEDGGIPPRTSMTTVLINLINIDDECPRFENPVFIEELPYDVTDTPPGVGTEILTVMATDPDRFSEVTYSIIDGHTDILALNSDTGVITLASTDRDPRGQYTLNVSASDQSCTNQSFVRVEIGIGNVNNHSPQFQSDCIASLLENPPPETEVTTLIATDADIGFNGLVTYSLLSGTEFFTIDNTGVVRTIASQTYDREAQSILLAGVTASDGGGRQDYCLLTVTLIDENDNAPRIPLSTYSTSLARDSGIGTFVLQITADDPDIGNSSHIVYSIDTPGSLPFQINGNNGVITTSEALSSTSMYTFTVVAADMGPEIQLTSNTTVIITVTEDGANLPRFSQQNYTGVTCENRPFGATVLTVNISNPSNFIQFDIIAGSDYRSNSEGAFEVRESTSQNAANIIVGSRTLVDFERLVQSHSFQFFIQARNEFGSSIAPVEIFVMDVDDNVPQFQSHTTSITIAENEPIGTTVAQVQAIDNDSGTNGEVLYRLAGGMMSPFFNITRDGLIRSIRVFDFEGGQTTSGSLFIEAYNPNPPSTNLICGTMSTRPIIRTIIDWNILDQNDNPPSFLASTFRVEVREDVPILSRIIRLNATDQDISDLGGLSFSITSGNDGTFRIESHYIILNSRLDFETTPMYELVVQVTDGVRGVQDCPQSQCVATVRIVVTNVDDEPPVFSSFEYNAMVMENAPLGTTVLTVSTTDIDSPSIQYRLTGLAVGRFNISQSGAIIVAGPIDREAFPGGRMVFLVFAEGGSLATADIVIDIQDVNDYEPRFSGVFTGRVEENTPPGINGIVVSQVSAVDLDQGENGEVTYSLVSGEEHGFRIDDTTGEITAHAQYDRETTPTFVLIIEARDNGTLVQLSSQTQVVIEIGDVNDNGAHFPFPYMYARVFENSPVGHSVITLPTVDPDSQPNARAHFNLLDSNPSEPKFMLNSNTGEVTITGSLDYEIPQHRLYTLTVSVADVEVGPTSDGTLQIELLDRNDNPPTIDSVTMSQRGQLQETFPVGVQVAMVTASDPDSGKNSDLTFEISAGNTDSDFELLMYNKTAVIRTAKPLDYETTLTYDLVLTVSDRGFPQLSTMHTIVFNVIDVNDEPPIFTQTEYTVSITENTPPTDNLTQIEATDPDTGNGGQIEMYRIISGNSGEWFNLSTSGVLASLTVFDREKRSEYVLTVVAYDSGSVPLQGTAQIIVTITDVNDNPSFDGGHLSVLITALNGLITPGVTIAPLNFNDPDTDDTFSGCNVRSRDFGEEFQLDTRTCSILTDTNMPMEGFYNYGQVLGRDGRHVDVSASATIQVQHFTYEGPTSIRAQNIITLTLNASTEEYISEQLNSTFPQKLAQALEITNNNLIIITVQRGALNPNTTVDVTFIAEDGSGNYISPPALLHQLFVKRDSLEINGHALLSLPFDLCATEPCQNQASCQTLQNFVNTEKVISTREFVYFAPRIEFSYECLCVPGTSGEHCEINFDDCHSNPCQQGAACTDLVGGFSCDCPEGYSGVDCSVPPEMCSTNLCQNGATCMIINGDISCRCCPGFYGDFCQYQYFIPSAVCSQQNPCQNNGECSPGRDAVSCVCQPGFSGQFCETETQVQGGCIGYPCYNGSTCQEIPQGPICSCSVGFTGPNCRWPLDSCELEPCQNGGTCITGLYGTHVCSCTIGFTGNDCSILTPACQSASCMNNARCVDMEGGSFVCECLPGYYGDSCEFTAMRVDLCAMEDCSDNGNCTFGRDSFTCTCEEDYIGDDCSIFSISNDMPCAGNPCEHGGLCESDSISPDNFRCVCSPGFTGVTCDIDINECISNPCRNGGMCIDGINGYLCDCPVGLVGYDCEVWCPEGLNGTLCQTPIPQCVQNPCLNNGSCVQNGLTVSCSCQAPYTGIRCEIELSCSESPCLNGGTCMQLANGNITCQCGQEFAGDNCELLTVSFSGSKTQSSYRAYDSLEIQGQGRIEFEFATVDRNGLLLYNTHLQNGRTVDFIAVEIVGGALQVSLSLGSGGSSVQFVSSAVGVSDGEWHQVVMETSGKELKVTLDDCIALPSFLLAFASCTALTTTPGTNRFLDLRLPLWLGGVPFQLPPNSTISSQGITGCIRGVKINGRLMDLEGYVFESNSQRGCSHLESGVCDVEPSVCGGGQCVPVFDGESCDCPPRVEGRACERAANSIMFGGHSFAEYTLLMYWPSSATKRQTPAISLRSTISDELSLWFRTEVNIGQALLLYMGNEEAQDELYLQLEDGLMYLYINLGSMTERIYLTSKQVTDSAWHFVEIKRSALDLITTIDNTSTHHILRGVQISLDITPIIYAGGRPESGGTNISTPYSGCLEDIRINQTPLPIAGSDNFASVIFNGEEISYNCALGLCLPNPCDGGNCTEISVEGGSSFECECDRGEVVRGRACPGVPGPPMFTLIIVFGTVAGGLLLCVILILIGVLCCYCCRSRMQQKKGQVADNIDLSLAILNRQCLGVSNESGGGERDTHFGISEMTTTLFANKHAIEGEKQQQSESSSASDTSIVKLPISTIERANSPTIGAFIKEKIEDIPKEYRDFDSLCEFADEGEGSMAGSLSTICSSLAGSEYTVEKLREAGPEFAPFIDLLAGVLKPKGEGEGEEMEVDEGSQQAHTGNTQPTQGTLYSQEFW